VLGNVIIALLREPVELRCTERPVPMTPRKPPTKPANTIQAILTDIQFWIPAGILLCGIALLVVLH